jgi:hypothetical protein
MPRGTVVTNAHYDIPHSDISDESDDPIYLDLPLDSNRNSNVHSREKGREDWLAERIRVMSQIA